MQPISELELTQEEADTQILLHAVHAARLKFASVVIVSEDTDVLVLLLTFKSFVPSSMFIKCGSQTRVKYIEVSRVVESIGASVCRSLLGFHTFSGCDYSTRLLYGDEACKDAQNSHHWWDLAGALRMASWL